MPEPSFQAPLPEFDPKALRSLRKLGGIKKIDELLGQFRANSGVYLQTLKELAPGGAEEARGVLRRLQSSAARLGALGLEERCAALAAEIASRRTLPPAGGLRELEDSVERAKQWLEKARKEV